MSPPSRPRRRLRILRGSLAAAALACLVGCSDDVQLEPDRAYLERAARVLRVDVASPARRLVGGRPAILAFHGGSFVRGDKSQLRGIIRAFAERGYVAASAQYRLGERFPAALQDARCAVRWLRSNARELGIDPRRITTLGFSAGATLALQTGLLADAEPPLPSGCDGAASARADAVVAAYGVSDFALPLPRVQPALDFYLGPPEQRSPELIQLASPIYQLDRDDPPLFLMHGEADDVVPIEHTLALRSMALANDVTSEVLTFPGGHYLTPPQQRRLVEAADDFLTRSLPRAGAATP